MLMNRCQALTGWLLAALWLVAATSGSGAAPLPAGTNGLRDATVLIIRHAEKTTSGDKLSPQGEQRAAAYPAYFQKYQIGGRPVRFDRLFATANSKGSQRPLLTIAPLGKALNLPIDQRFANKQFPDLAREVKEHCSGQTVLISWHHGKIAALIAALGGDPAKLLPGGEWPAEQFAWVIQLRFDHEGHLVEGETRRVAEKLLPGDTD